jgi:hypothetical protein
MTEEAKTAAKTYSEEEFNKAVERARTYEAKAEDLSRQVKEIGLSPVEARAMKQAYDDLKRDSAVGDPKKFDEELRRREVDIRTQVQKEIDELKGSYSKLAAHNKELEVTDRVFSQAAAKFNEDVHDDVKAYIRRFGDKAEDGSIIFKDDSGKPRYVAGSTTQLMGPKEFTEWLVATKPSWAKATAVPGSMQPGTKVNGTGAPKTYNAAELMGMSESEKNEIFKRDPDAARAYLSTVKLS